MKMISHVLALAFTVVTGGLMAGPVEGGFLKAKGKGLVDEKGRHVVLRGIGLGNWYLPEGYMWKFGPQGDRPRKIEAVIEKAIGKAEAVHFWKTFRDRFVTEADIAKIASLGFNSVRPALKARDFLTEEAKPRFLDEGFQRLDQLVGWCRKYNLYCILDLHAAPGGQTGKNIDDSATDHPDMYRLRSFQDQTVEIWKRLATRYKDDAVVGGYDLLNEPLPAEFNRYNPQVEPFYKRVTKEIRAIDTKHMIILEGANWANDWSVFGAPFDSNLMYQFHKYWNDPDKASVQGYLDFQDRHPVPVWVGEYGEPKVGIHWILAATQLFEDVGFHWSYWTWKRLDADAPVYSINLPAGWDKIVAISNGQAAPPRAEGRRILAEFLENIRIEKCRQNTPVVQALFRRVPNLIEAEDFGHLGEGKSFHVTSSGRRAKFYRKGEPVEIQSLGAGQGNNVGWTEKGEWLQYELNCESDGSYDFAFRVAAEGAGNTFHLEQDGKNISGEIAVPSTGAWTKWTTFEKKGINLKKGALKLKVFFTTGGFNLDYFTAALSGSEVPTRAENKEMRRGKTGTLPGKVEAEDFGLFGEGRSFHDNDPANQGGSLRTTEGVDIQAVEENAGLSILLSQGEWVNYEINSLTAQKLRVTAKVMAEGAGVLDVILDGKAAGSIKAGGAWTEAAGGSLALSAGRHYLGLKARQGNISVDWVDLRP